MEASHSIIIPGIRYHDANKAIEFLSDAFGFKKLMVVPSEDGTVPHAQLTLGNSMIMLGSHRHEDGSDNDRLIKSPSDINGVNTQSLYVIVKDVDGHHDKAKAAGAKIVTAPIDQDYGGRLYTALDTEGNFWHFGSYNPWD